MNTGVMQFLNNEAFENLFCRGVTLVEKDDLYIRYGCITSLAKVIISS